MKKWKLIHKITKEKVVGECGTAVRQGSSLPFSALLGASGWPWASQFTLQFLLGGGMVVNLVQPLRYSPCAGDWRYPNNPCGFQHLCPNTVTLLSLSTGKVPRRQKPVFQMTFWATCWSSLLYFVCLRWRVFEACLCCTPHFGHLILLRGT